MNKISVTLDLSKINKDRIVSRTFTNKEGVEVTVKEYKIDVIPLREPKFIKQGEGWNLLKTHFVVEGQTKEERQAKTKSIYIGEGMQFVDTSTQEVNYPEPTVQAEKRLNSDGTSPDDIPF